MTLLQSREIERSRYAEFLQQSTPSAFHRLEWLEQIERVYSVHLVTLGHFTGEVLVAVTPLIRRRMGIFDLWGSPMRQIPVPPSTSFCVPQEQGCEAWIALQQWAKHRGLAYLQVTLPPGADVQQSRKLHIETVENIEIDLQKPLEQLWQNVSQLPKRCVRGAVRGGVKIHWKFNPRILDDQALLLEQTYAQQGLAPNFPLGFYRALLENRDRLGLKILCATHSGQCVAVIWVMTDRDCCYYWDAAALDEGRKLSANHLLVWSLIRWAKRNGFKTLDFVGAGGRAGTKPGIKRFKMSMGGIETSRQIIFKMTPFMHLALNGFRLMSKVKSRLASNLGKYRKSASDGGNSKGVSVPSAAQHV